MEFWDEYLQPCSCSIALLNKLREDPWHQKYFGPSNTIDTYVLQYGNQPFSLQGLSLTVEDAVPLYSYNIIARMVGRHKKIERAESTSNSPRQCYGCNGYGHFLSTCPKLNLYNVAMNRKTEIKKRLPSLCGVVTGFDRIEEVNQPLDPFNEETVMENINEESEMEIINE